MPEIMQTLARGVAYTDLHFLGSPTVIATGVLQGAAGVALVDPGPTSCLGTLKDNLAQQGIAVADVRTLLLTHIHLDHAGASGSLVRENPKIEVVVHERGAQHMADPVKLLDSAKRLYGDEMDRLWGEFVPVPESNLRVLAGGERIEVADRRFEVAYTPGHASHHVSYYDPASGIAFVGDTLGVRTGPTLFVMPPTPPPDIDLERWSVSLDIIEGWRPQTLFVTHFGPHNDAEAHLRVFPQHLDAMSQMVKRSLEGEGSDDERIARFKDEMRVYLRRYLSEDEATRYDRAAPLSLGWLGLARYWRKKAAN